MAYGLQDQEKTENILTCWINALTIDNSLFPDVAESLELLRNENPNHTVVLLLDLLYYLVTREPEKAKSLLFEYKNLLIARLETDNEKRRAIFDMIRKDTSLSEIQRRRIICLFENRSNQNMLQELESIYKDTGLTLDIINVILCGQETRNWNKSLEYAQILKEKHHYYYGYLYEIQFIDSQKSLEYAEKYVESSKHSPGALAWAATSAANIGRSDVMEQYWRELMRNHPDSEDIKPISLEECTDMIRNGNIQLQECITKYNHAEIPLHVFLDVTKNVLLSGMFYDNWNNSKQFSMLFLADFISK